MECRVQSVCLALDHVLRRGRLELLVAHHDDDATVIETTTPSTPRHLDVLARGEIPEVVSIELTCRHEDDSLGGHVQANGERFSSEQDLDESFLEQNLDDFFEDGE